MGKLSFLELEINKTKREPPKSKKILVVIFALFIISLKIPCSSISFMVPFIEKNHPTISNTQTGIMLS